MSTAITRPTSLPAVAGSSLDEVDVLIVGAGLSGIGAAVHLQRECPGASYAIVEARDAIGGTWDLFRYPGVRSDSDMFTLGYSFRPWVAAKSIADGPSILNYIRETAVEYGVESHIHYGKRVVEATWSTDEAAWSVGVQEVGSGTTSRVRCRFLFACAGYYRYDEGYCPQFPGADRFAGRLVHPQHWPEDLDYAGKRVVVIGSGATAVTLVPAMAETAEQVTMLQRSPTYILSLPAEDAIAQKLRRHLGPRTVYSIVRWKNVLISTLIFQLSRRRPNLVKGLIRRGLEKQLPPGYDIDTHFRPRYNPWDQRLCLVPDGDLFRAIRRGRASVVTGQIETFTETGVRLTTGAEVAADIIVTATGLSLVPIGGIRLTVDGRPVSIPDSVAYKGMMLCGVPNFAFTVGYTNASWTLKADLVASYVCRLLNHLKARGLRQCTPMPPPEGEETVPLLDLNSGYVTRALATLPRQGSRAPWRLFQNYTRDVLLFRRCRLEDESMRFSNPAPAAQRSRVSA
jgi:monooxygenase